MRVHVQNPADDALFAVTPAQWEAAIARSPDMAGLAVSFADDEAGFVRAMAEAEVLLTWTKVVHARFPRGALPGVAPGLRIIACTSAGLDRLAPFDWLPPDVALLNNRGTHAHKAGEYGIMAMLMLNARLPEMIAAQRVGRWAPIFSSTLEGRTVVIVGVGSLGGGVAKRARQFGMRVIGVRGGRGPHPDCDEVVPTGEIEHVLPRAEHLVLTCPLTPATRGLLSRARIALLPKGARLVNMARGAVWDQDAVCDALDSGHLDACVTDVATPEPLPPDHRLWRTRGMVVTPHVSSDDRERYNDRTLDILFENLRAGREGRPLPNRVDPARGY